MRVRIVKPLLGSGKCFVAPKNYPKSLPRRMLLEIEQELRAAGERPSKERIREMAWKEIRERLGK